MDKTLWAFGCSETFGLWLPDCIPTEFETWGLVNLSPSNLSWPKIVANKLGYQCKNLGKSGNSNKGIVLDILHNIENFQPDDIICIQWTFGVRENVYISPERNVNLNTFAVDKKGKKMVHLTLKDRIMKAYEKFLQLIDYETTSTIDKFIYIDYINNKIKKNKVFNFCVDEGVWQGRETKIDPFWKIDTKILSTNKIGRMEPSKAADGHHTGVKGHELLGKHYYNLIKDDINENKKFNPFLKVYNIDKSEYKTDKKNTILYLGKHEHRNHKKAIRFNKKSKSNQFNLPVAYTLNSMGYRCKYDQLPNKDYILVAGCSISYGYAIPQEYRYSDLLEKHYKMPVLNISVSGGSCNLIRDNILQLLKGKQRLPKVLIAQWPAENRYWIGTQHYGIDAGNEKGFIQSSQQSFEVTNYLCKIYNIPILNVKDYRSSNNFDINLLANGPYCDYGRDNDHPGIKTHKLYANNIIELLNQYEIIKGNES